MTKLQMCLRIFSYFMVKASHLSSCMAGEFKGKVGQGWAQEEEKDFLLGDVTQRWDLMTFKIACLKNENGSGMDGRDGDAVVQGCSAWRSTMNLLWRSHVHLQDCR